MNKLDEFLAVMRAHANPNGIVVSNILIPLFKEKSKSYVSHKIFLLKGKGLVETIVPGVWRVLPSVFSAKEAEQIFDIKQSIQKKLKDLELAKMDVEDLKKEIFNLEKRL